MAVSSKFGLGSIGIVCGPTIEQFATVDEGHSESEGKVHMSKSDRDVERGYSTAKVVAKLRRLADALETGRPFRIQVAGERIYVPTRAEFTVEHERGSDEEEVEFQLKWRHDEESDQPEDDELVV